MKTIFFCLFSFLILNTYAQNNTHIGTWKGVDKDETINMTFREDGFILLEIKGMVFGGKEFEMKGRKMSTSYKIESMSPSPRFTVMLKNLETNEVESRMTGTITFKENNTAYICMKPTYENETDIAFEEKDCLLFTKIK